MFMFSGNLVDNSGETFRSWASEIKNGERIHNFFSKFDVITIEGIFLFSHGCIFVIHEMSQNDRRFHHTEEKSGDFRRLLEERDSAELLFSSATSSSSKFIFLEQQEVLVSIVSSSLDASLDSWLLPSK